VGSRQPGPVDCLLQRLDERVDDLLQQPRLEQRVAGGRTVARAEVQLRGAAAVGDRQRRVDAL
jgi:hypothetical protein